MAKTLLHNELAITEKNVKNCYNSCKMLLYNKLTVITVFDTPFVIQ